jgi:16S rRNA (guanine(966)-N(2))-methyltransferase RsmD
LRIIAGECKGRRLRTPSWDGLRPTSDKLRETLFNIVGPRLPDAAVLDLFAGTGAMGLESLSRGARLAVFVESDRRAAALIAENAVLCGVRDRCAIIRDTAARALMRPIAGDPFELIIMDPPYGFEPLAAAIAAAAPHLAPGGRLVLEHARRRAVPDAAGVRVVRTVLSGDSALTIFEAA